MSRDDQRLRELASRLVAMAPEPPPFPEEQITLSTPTPKPRPRPILAFVGAALLVLVGAAIPLVLLNSNGTEPVATTQPTPPTTVAPGTTDAPGTSQPGTDTSEPTQTTQPPTGMASFFTSVFLAQDPENSFTGNPALVPFWTEIEAPDGSSVELLRLQLLTRDDLELPAPGFFNLVPPDAEFLDLTWDGRTIILDVNEAFREGTGGLLSDFTMLNQIVYTATYMNDAEAVRFLIDGQEVTDFGSDGIDLTGGVTRETFRDSLNSIIVTEPLIYGQDGLPIVAGVANVFEATVSLDIIDANGEVSYQDFTTATCGTGCWGEFSFSLDTPAIRPDAVVRVFWNSAQDGSPSDIVYIPVDEDGIWQLTPSS